MPNGASFPLNSRVLVLPEVAGRPLGAAPVGEVVGRADFAHREDEYLVRYNTLAGPAERWWGESALAPAPEAAP